MTRSCVSSGRCVTAYGKTTETIIIRPARGRAADATVSVAGAVLRVLGTILLIVLVTGLLFLCIFAYYVKNCLSTDLDVQLSDFTVSLSSSILYEDSDGNWQNLTNLSSTENRVWVDYADIPKDMEHAAVAIEDKRFYKHKGRRLVPHDGRVHQHVPVDEKRLRRLDHHAAAH